MKRQRLTGLVAVVGAGMAAAGVTLGVLLAVGDGGGPGGQAASPSPTATPTATVAPASPQTVLTAYANYRCASDRFVEDYNGWVEGDLPQLTLSELLDQLGEWEGRVKELTPLAESIPGGDDGSLAALVADYQEALAGYVSKLNAYWSDNRWDDRVAASLARQRSDELLPEIEAAVAALEAEMSGGLTLSDLTRDTPECQV